MMLNSSVCDSELEIWVNDGKDCSVRDSERMSIPKTYQYSEWGTLVQLTPSSHS